MPDQSTPCSSFESGRHPPSLSRYSSSPSGRSIRNRNERSVSNLEQTAAAVFRSLDNEDSGWVDTIDIITYLEKLGFSDDDPRFKKVFKTLRSHIRRRLTFNDLLELIRDEYFLLERAFCGELAIPNFDEFRTIVTEVYHEVEHILDGNVATYIPQLASVNPSYFALSFCSLDGQRFSLGDSDVDFCVQSCCKPINYCIAIEENTLEEVHSHIGREPSGSSFNNMSLNSKNLPHNPLINSGAIMTCSLIQRGQPLYTRFESIIQTWSKLCGGKKVNFNNSVYLSERQTADRNFCLGYMMREVGAFPKGTDLLEVLDLYFQTCSIEMNTEKMAIAAGTLANGGQCPLTGEQVFHPNTVKNCVSIMSSCGMYNYSGEWTCTVGIPAKSGVSGAIYAITNVGGFCVYSPALDEIGNSTRGVAFFKRLIERLNIIGDTARSEFWAPPALEMGGDEIGNYRFREILTSSASVLGYNDTLSGSTTESLYSYQRPGCSASVPRNDSPRYLKDTHLGDIESEEDVQRVIEFIQSGEESLRLDHALQPSLKLGHLKILLRESLQSEALLHLSLNGNTILENVFPMLAESLNMNTSLRALQLDGVIPGSAFNARDGLTYFKRLLRSCFEHSSLELLSLNGNHICKSKPWVEEVINGIQNPSSKLKQLYMNDNIGIRNLEICRLLGAINNNSTLEEVRLVIPCEHQINIPFYPYATKGLFGIDVLKLIRSTISTHPSLKTLRLNKSSFEKHESYKKLGGRCNIEFDNF